MFRKTLLSWITPLFGVLSAHCAQAAALHPLDGSAFAAAIQGSQHLQVQDFDGVKPGIAVTRLGDVTFKASWGVLGTTTRYQATSGQNTLGGLDGGAINQENSLTITFDNPIDAFAIDIESNGGGEKQFYARTDNGDSILSVAKPQTRGFSFIGFVSDEKFSRITLMHPPFWEHRDRANPFVVDTLIYGSKEGLVSAVPEPGTWMLMLLGFGPIGMALRRRPARVQGWQMV